jgi:hypothetical protein
LNALPVACSNDWLGPSACLEAPPIGAAALPATPALPHVEQNAPDLDPAQRGFLELRLEAALGRLTAMETLLEAERLHARQAQTALGVAERALQRHRETIVAADLQRQEASGEIERLKQGLHEAALGKARQDHHIAALATALAGKNAEIERLKDIGADLEADLRATRNKQNAASDTLQRECLRLEEALQGERRDKVLLQRALDLARANRRALQDQLQQPTGPRPPDHRIALRSPSGTGTRFLHPSDTPPANDALLPVVFLPAAALPASHTLEQDEPVQPSCPALTEHLHAACN